MISKLLSLRRWYILASLGALCSPVVRAQQPGYFMIHGHPRSCYNIIELDYARQRNDVRYYIGWTDQDYEAAVAWASACAQYGYPGWGPSRFQYLRALQEQARQLARQRADAEQAAAEQAAAAQALREKEAQARAEQQAEQVQAEQARQLAAAREQEALRVAAEKAARALQECREGVPYKLFLVRKQLLDDLAQKQNAEAALAKENKISELTGTENMAHKYYDGQAIVDADDRVARDFRAYKSYGGAADAPERVETAATAPCAGSDSQ
jgi:chemotaxis protein histidine kinase CheA